MRRNDHEPGDAQPIHEPLRPELQAKCIELLYAQASNAYTSSIVAGSVLGALYWPIANRAVIVAWALAYAAMIGVRYALGRRFQLVQVAPSNASRWLMRFGLAVAACGVLWGAFAVYLVQFEDPYRQAVVVIAIGALVSGAVTAYSVSMPVLLGFTVPAMLPLGLAMLAQGAPGPVLLGALILAWLGFMIGSAQRFRRFVVESLDFQFENAQLVDSLEEERDRVTELARQLKMLSSTDALTGLANRRAFDEALEAAWSRCAATRCALGLVTVDIDYFKAYNDLYGHPQGDESLRRIAEVFAREAARRGAVAARLGGEEFAVLVQDCDARRA
ncbi:MAG TPA: GGDEF domain-containing protein, partial [Xanthomonadales bacterium]|nr:GGDEF domain-containing protein [Xanthomonadales bacterium]